MLFYFIKYEGNIKTKTIYSTKNYNRLLYIFRYLDSNRDENNIIYDWTVLTFAILILIFIIFNIIYTLRLGPFKTIGTQIFSVYLIMLTRLH